MSTNKQNPLNLFIIIAGTVLIFQIVLALGSLRTIEFGDLGMLSKDMVLALMVMVVTLSFSLVLLSVLSLFSGLMPRIDLTRFHLLPLVAGVELIVLGLASVNLSRYVTIGTTVSIMPMGIELFSVGMISIALFVENMGSSCAIKNLPNYSFLLFFLSLLPAALLIMN